MSSPERENEEDVELLNLLQEESDKGCVLTACAYIDEALKELPQFKLYRNDEVKKELRHLFDGTNPPLQSLAVCNRLAYGLGLIHESIFLAMKLLIRIRNDFAHRTGPQKFTDPRIEGLNRSLDGTLLDETKKAGDPELGNRVTDRQWGPPRAKFTVVVVMILAAIAQERRRLADQKEMVSNPSEEITE